jgi:hypothetical protein
VFYSWLYNQTRKLHSVCVLSFSNLPTNPLRQEGLLLRVFFYTIFPLFDKYLFISLLSNTVWAVNKWGKFVKGWAKKRYKWNTRVLCGVGSRIFKFPCCMSWKIVKTKLYVLKFFSLSPFTLLIQRLRVIYIRTYLLLAS